MFEVAVKEAYYKATERQIIGQTRCLPPMSSVDVGKCWKCDIYNKMHDFTEMDLLIKHLHI